MNHSDELSPEELLAAAQAEPDPRLRDSKLLALLCNPPFCNHFSQFGRAFLRIVDKEGTLRKFEMNRPQRRLQAMIERQRRARRPRRIAVPKARQEGVSTWAEGIIFSECCRYSHRSGLVIAHKLDSSVALFKMTKRYEENLPYRPLMRYSNRKELIFDAPIHSQLTVESAENRDAGRGITPQLVHCSEVAFWPDATTTMSGFLPAVPKNPQSLVILESTGNGVGGWFYETCMLAKEGKSQFELAFLPWYDLDEYRMPVAPGTTWESMDLDAEEVALRDTHGITMEQMQWRRWMVLEFGGNMEKFTQEYPVDLDECFQSRGAPVFRARIIKDQMARAVLNPPKHRGSAIYEGGAYKFRPASDGPLHVWELPKGGQKYVLGVDSGLGYASSDYSVISVLDAVTGDQVAEMGGRWDSETFSAMCIAVGHLYNTAFMCVEVNSHGLYVVNAIRDAGYQNMLHRETWEPATRKYQEKVGWQTSVKTRPVMIDFAVNMLHDDENPVQVRSKTCLEQMSRFQFGEDGKAEVPKGEHDDHLFAWMLALQAFKFQSKAGRVESPRKEYTGPDAWAWRSMDRRIRRAERMKRRVWRPGESGFLDRW